MTAALLAAATVLGLFALIATSHALRARQVVRDVEENFIRCRRSER